ncbi:MAG: hypothetical protein QOI40_1430, partial [Alphaproteobacteria bacterium]|nr:hypothetical protein [Alphaproteobacteria bacterium]
PAPSAGRTAGILRAGPIIGYLTLRGAPASFDLQPEAGLLNRNAVGCPWEETEMGTRQFSDSKTGKS